MNLNIVVTCGDGSVKIYDYEPEESIEDFVRRTLLNGLSTPFLNRYVNLSSNDRQDGQDARQRKVEIRLIKDW